MKKKITKAEINHGEVFDSAIDKIMSDRFGRYAKYIIQDRALPDVRDGLKPVQRRILYALYTLNLNFDTAPKKSARIVGEVIGKYHPHGDTAVYEAMVRMSQSWKLLFPLIDMQGNNGSIDGDSAAAMRYTEARLAKISQLLLNNLDKKTVPMAPNFDDSESEPTVLPALFPNILVNGSSGIAAGYATNIPPHNLNEIIDATILLIQSPHIKLDTLLNIIKGPDFPTGGVIHGREGIRQAFSSGKGKITLSAKWHKEPNKIVIDEIPYEVIKQDLIRKIGDLIDLNPGLAIRDVRDETDRTGLRIVIELENEGKRDTVRKFLFKNTALSITFNYNNVMIVDKQPKLLNLIAILNAYINHLRTILTRKSEFEYEKAKKRLEIIKGLIKMTGKLSPIIKTIRHSANRQEAITNLKKSPFRFSEVQAIAIVDMRLYRLSATDVKKLESEKEELQKEINHLRNILNKPEEMNKMMVSILTDIKNDYGKERKTTIEEVSQDLDITIKDTMVEKDFNLWVSRDGYIKAIDSAIIEKNVWDNFGRKPEDLWIGHRKVSNFNYLLLISNLGSYYSIPLYKIPLSKWTDPGIHINTIVTMQPNEKIINAFVVPDYEKATQHLLIASKNGLIKRVVISCLSTKIFSKSFRIMRLENDDQIVSVDLVTSKVTNVFVASSEGHGVRYEIETIPLQTPGAKGVRALNLKTETLAFATSLREKDNILFITNRATYKKIPQTDIPIRIRPKRGINLYSKTKNKVETIVNGLSVSLGDKINLLSVKNQTEIISSDDLCVTNINTKTRNWKLPILDLANEELNQISSDDFPLKPAPDFDNNIQCTPHASSETEAE